MLYNARYLPETSPYMELVSIPANPVPEGVKVGTLTTPDGVALRYAVWQPPPGRKGTLCILPGRAEFIEKYFEVVNDARARGLAVAMFDWRGQGRSGRALTDRRKGHVRSFAEYDLDLESFIKEIVLPDCPPPLFALGHSMGASILLRAAHGGRRWFDRIVLSAPMIELVGPPASRGARLTARFMRLGGFRSSYIPGGGATAVSSRPFLGNPVTSDPVRYAPQFGNYCAMALSKGEVVVADPENWLINEGKLYIFGKPAPAGPALFTQNLEENIAKANQSRSILPR